MAAVRVNVVLSLDNVLLPEEKLQKTPSMAHGLEREIETDLRILGCEFIQSAGVLLRLPQVETDIQLSVTMMYCFWGFRWRWLPHKFFSSDFISLSRS
jgi:hypothetical protein